ncbi:MAG: tRNA methyl transferase PRC-barrel domain-containing protein, partial [Acidimicrobiia bacterium]
AAVLGYDALATGHHARVSAGPDGRFRLRRGHDRAKDQSYVLYMLGQDVLSSLLLPVGELTKAEVRAEAAALRLRTADKPESMEVCFITRGGREAFLAARGAMTPGEIVDADGRHLGRHEGAAALTVGQRRGLGVAVGERRYVLDVDPASGRVTVGAPENLLRASVTVSDLCFVSDRPSPTETLSIQTRAHATPTPGHLHGNVVSFTRPQPRVAPGQVVAFYRDGDDLIGGGLAL